MCAHDYQTAKLALVGVNGPFCGWVRSDSEWENFDAGGNIVSTDPHAHEPAVSSPEMHIT